MSEHAPPVIRAEDLEVSYGGVRALNGVTMELEAGSITALLGGNGAGKSTLMKCLTGVVVPDAGQVLIDGKPVRFSHPDHAIAAGVRVVYQELSLFPTLSVTENILGPHGMGRWIRWRKLRRLADAAMASVGVRLDGDQPVGQMSIGEQQIVEIVRAVRSGGRVLILDEPTSALGPDQARRLFELMRSLAEAGMAVVFVTQDFGDAQRHADLIMVMREGQIAGTFRPAETTTLQLVHTAFGSDRDILESAYETGHVRLPAAASGQLVLEVEAVESRPMVSAMSLTARAGEVLGLFGTLDSGHMAFAEAVFGSRSRSAGQVTVAGRVVAPNKPEASVRRGIGFLSADRREALALTHQVAHNVTLAHLGNMARWLVPAREEEKATTEMIAALRIKSARPGATVETLSGGNQQKVLFARWMLVKPKVLMLVEPTRGMDIAAKSDVIRIIRDQAAAGAAIVVVSAEPEIILSVADRILVARKGVIEREFADQDVSVADLIGSAA
jgi:ribose transport system ATP-binding protein